MLRLYWIAFSLPVVLGRQVLATWLLSWKQGWGHRAGSGDNVCRTRGTRTFWLPVTFQEIWSHSVSPCPLPKWTPWWCPQEHQFTPPQYITTLITVLPMAIQVKYGEAGMQTQVFLTLKMRGFLWCHSARVLCVLLHTGLPWGQSSSSFNYLKPSPKGPYFFRQSYSSMYNENRVFKMKKVLENLVSMVITHLPLGLQYFQ